LLIVDENGAAAAADSGATEDQKLFLSELSDVLKAYHITSKTDLAILDAKYKNLKSSGVHGLALLQELHNIMHEIRHLKVDKFRDSLFLARERVTVLMQQVVKENYVNFMVGLDGSRASNNAYEVCLTELVRSRDGIIGLHFFDSTKSNANLSQSFKPEPLKEKFNLDLTVRSNVGRFTLNWLDKKGQRTDTFVVKTVNDMCEGRDKLLEKERPSFLVTGYTGRKKANLTGKKEIGTLALLAAGQLMIPTIIVKCEPVIDRPRIFVCAIKDAEHFYLYNLCLDLMKPGNGDKLFVIHIHAPDDGVMNEAQRERRENLENCINIRMGQDALTKNGSKFMAVCNKDKVPNYKLVLQTLEELEADYVVINPHIQVTGAVVPNNCELIIKEADCNIVVCHK
jgi:hypothetical protein